MQIQMQIECKSICSRHIFDYIAALWGIALVRNLFLIINLVYAIEQRLDVVAVVHAAGG